MTEVINSLPSSTFTESLVLDDHTLYHKKYDIPVPVATLYHHITEGRLGVATPTPRIEDLDHANDMRHMKYARYILDRLTRSEPSIYSSEQNRIVLNELAHPIHQYLATKQSNNAVEPQLAKDVEAIYGRGSDQLAFLLAQHDEYADINQKLGGEIEGGLSEFAFFLLTTRPLTDEEDEINPYLITPSTEAQDRAPVTNENIYQGFDFTVIRQADATIIPVQVKTGTTNHRRYPEHILVISMAELVNDNYATPRQLAEAMYLEMNGARQYNKSLIDDAAKRLFAAFDAYPTTS